MSDESRAQWLREQMCEQVKLTPEQIRLTQEMPGGKEVWSPDGSLKPFTAPPLTDAAALAEMRRGARGRLRAGAWESEAKGLI